MKTLFVLTAVLILGAAPRPVMTPEQIKQMRLRNALVKQGLTAWQEGQQEEAIAATEKRLALDLRIMGPWHKATVSTALRLGQFRQARGEWMAEAECWRLVAEAQRVLLGEGHWQTTDARMAMADALASAKHTPGQREALRRAKGWAAQAIAFHQEGEPTKGIPLAQKALATFKDILGERHPACAYGLNNLAMLHQAMGDYKTALPLYEKAAATSKEARGERHPGYASGLNNLAKLHEARGDLKSALLLHQRVMAIRKEVLGHRHAELAISLNNLALLHQKLGDHKAALALAKESLALRKELVGDKHHDYAEGLHNLAYMYRAAGAHEAALPLFTEALALFKRTLGERHPKYATCLDNLAGLRASMGDHEAALPMHEKALALRKALLGVRHTSYATSLNNLASLHQDRGDFKAALPLFKQALGIEKAALGERHLSYGRALSNLAALHLAMADPDAALPLAEKALAVSLAQLRDNASVQSERQQLADADQLRGNLDLRLSLPDGPGHPPAADHALAWKGAVLLRQQQSRLFLRLGSDPVARKAADDVQDVTRRLAALLLSPTASKASLDALEKEQDLAQARLSRLSEGFREQRENERTSVERLARSLPDGVVLVDYLFHAQYGITDKDGKRRRSRRLVAFVTRKGRPTARVGLGDAGPIEDAVGRWRALLADGRPAHEAGAVVKRLVHAPLEKHLAGAGILLVAPDGALASVPFAALPGKKAGSYLIEDIALAVVPVPRAIPDLMKPVDDKERHPPSLLVVGGVDYDSAGVAGAGEGMRSAPFGPRQKWGALPGAATEAAAVARVFVARFKGEARALAGPVATKPAVADAMARARWVHLATHGYFVPETVKDPGKGGREIAGWHPLLLSGLAFAGANKEPKPGEVDGILTALEVSEMDLTKLELAVLSACETGLGKAAGGEGLLGMQRAFAAAGARSVVASLWKVDDRATQQLMGDFYSLAWDTARPIVRAEALRKAQLAMLFGKTLDGKPRGVGAMPVKLPMGVGERLPPYYWAAFVLSGDWR